MFWFRKGLGVGRNIGMKNCYGMSELGAIADVAVVVVAAAALRSPGDLDND